MTIPSRLERLEARHRPTTGVDTIVVNGDEEGPKVEEAARYAEANNKLLVIRNFYQPWPHGRAA